MSTLQDPTDDTEAEEERPVLKVGILSRNQELFSTRSLVRAGEARGHEVHVIDYLRCHMNITSHNPRIYLGDEELTGFDAIIPRIGTTHTFFGTAVVRQFEMMGVYCVNESVAISRSRDKLRSLQLLARKGIGLPVTGFAHDTDATQHLIDLCGGAPLVIKLLEGTQGVGVVLAETPQAAESVIEAFRGLDANILVQEFIAEAGGSDIRCLVVGDKCVAAMRRTAKEGEFRSNLHRGGEASLIKITPEDGGVRMDDVLHYKLPLGPLGALAGALFVHAKVRSIFAYRTEALQRLFPGTRPLTD
jgi:ribosomal protein S6--L-glutamate ligase